MYHNICRSVVYYKKWYLKKVRAIMNKRFSLDLRFLTLGLLVSGMFIMSINAQTVYYSETSLKSGYTSHSFPSDNSNGWSIARNTSVKLFYTLGSREINVHYGLVKGSDGNHFFQTLFSIKKLPVRPYGVQGASLSSTVYFYVMPQYVSAPGAAPSPHAPG